MTYPSNPPTSALEKKVLVHWLRNHPVWNWPEPFLDDQNEPRYINCFQNLVQIYLAYVNPAISEVDSIDALNTKPEVWIEAGPYVPDEYQNSKDKFLPCHDYNLDCGGDTLEDALCSLAAKVREHYGDYNQAGEELPK
jgi:hypothetical protein